MKNNYSLSCLFFCLIFCGFSFTSFSQQLQIDSVVPTPATCEKNGQIVVNASGGVEPYTYALIAPSPTERPNQSSNTFGSLLPGEYTVQVTDSSTPTPQVVTTTASSPVIVEDQYVEPRIQSVDTTASSCPNDTDGSATINMNSDVTATPISYTLYQGNTATGPVVAGPQTSNVFNNLLTGQYTVLAIDQCGIQDPFTFLVETIDAFETTLFGNQYDCGQALVNVSSFTGGKAPYSYKVTNDDMGTTFSSGTYTPTDQVPVPYGANYTITFTDGCGTESTHSGFIENDPVAEVITSGSCGDQSTVFGANSGGLTCSDLEFCVRLVGTTDYTCQSSNVFDSLPNGDYEYRITNNCCNDVYTGTFGVASPTPTVVPERFDEGCLPGTNTYILNLFGFGDNINVELVSATPDHTYVDQDGNTQTATANFSQGDTDFTIINNNKLELGSVPPGTYSFRITDDCDNNILYEAQVTPNDVVVPDYFVEYTPACSGNTELNFGVRNGGGRDVSGFAGGSYIVVKDASGTELYRRDRMRVVDTNTLSVPPGTYTVEYSLNTRARNTLYGTCPSTYSKTIEVTNALPPDLSVTEFYRCTGTDATIVAGVVDGAAPFSYRIRELGETTWGPEQDSPVFTGLDDTKTYEIEVLDSCSRNNIKQVEAGGVLNDPVIDALYDCVAATGTASKVDLSATEVFGANYEWTNSAGTVVGNERELTVDPLVVGETYTVSVSIPSASGTCVAASSSISITTDSCFILPIELSDFSADLRDDFVQLNWTTLSEIDHDYFELERSADATDWTSIYTEIGRGGDTPYTYRYDDYEAKLGVNYYRLKIVSTNNEIEYSPVLVVHKELPNGVVSVAPNPVSNGTVTVSLPNNIDADGYSVYNMNGLKVAEADIAGKQFLIFTSEFSKGVYYILLSKDGQRVHKPLKIVVL